MREIPVEVNIPETPIESDICIIGSGAAGCVLAYELAKNGKKVVMLEKGSYYPKEWIKENENNEMELLKLWKNRGIFGSRNYPVNIGQGQCVGGSTMINYGIFFEIPDAVFTDWQQNHKVSISKDELIAAYKRVGKMISIRKIDPIDAGKSHVKLKEGCDKLGYSSDWMSKAYIPGLGKQSAYDAYLQKANFDNIKIYPDYAADRILTKDKKVIGVAGEFRPSQSGELQKFTVNAKSVVLSAGPIGSSELLLRSHLCNSNGQVGKYLSIHPTSCIVAEFDESMESEKGFAMGFYCDEFSIRKKGEPGYMIESILSAPSQDTILRPTFGDKKEDYLRNYNHLAMAGVVVHDEPNGTVILNWKKSAVVDYKLGLVDQKKMTEGLKHAAMIYLAAGAKRILTGHTKKTDLFKKEDLKLIDQRGADAGALLITSINPQGGNRMGEDKSGSVVDSNCQTHEIDSLYVCDASIFPSSLGVQPQYTVMAMATLTSDHIINKVK